jgi:sirohydrochlorin cobaltochelatase
MVQHGAMTTPPGGGPGPPAPPGPGGGPAPALLLIAHGTREPRGAEEMAHLLRLLRQRLPAPVEAGWLEAFAEPDVATAARRLVEQGGNRVVSIPFLALGARHAKSDVPRELAHVRREHPSLTLAHGRTLGLHPTLFALARRRVDAVSRPDGRDHETLVVVASGSSDPDANGDLAKAARFLAEGSGHRWVEYAFAGVTWPTIDVVLHRVGQLGARRAVVFSWSLLAGLLEQRVALAAAGVGAETGLEIVDAGRFGPDPLVAEVIVDRYREVLEGDPRMNCDLCAYRYPLPGLERRVGAPSAGGTGERVGLGPPGLGRDLRPDPAPDLTPDPGAGRAPGPAPASPLTNR